MAESPIKINPRFPILFKIKKNYHFLVIVGLSMLLRAYLPGDGGSNSPHDDLLGVRLGHNLIQGNWLGDWNVNTLAKPPLFSMYLTIIHFIPIPYKYVNHALFLLVAACFTHYITEYFYFKRFLRLARIISFSLFAFNPFIFQIGFNRVYRQSLVVSLIVAYFAFCILILASIQKLKFDSILTFKIRETKQILIGSAILGLLYGLLELTNATSYWILPISVSVILWNFCIIKCNRKIRIKLISITILTGVISYLAPTAIVKGINNHLYGSYRSENFYSGGFAQAINTWASVENGSDVRSFIAISAGQRQAVYKISPLASSLELYLENPSGTGWKSASCNSPIKVCDESANWFSWQLRDAAVQAHKLSNEKDFQIFFDNLALEISQACKKQQILCGNPGSGPGSKAFTELNAGLLWQYFKQNMFYAFSFVDGGSISTPDQYGSSPEIIKEWHKVVNYSPFRKSISSSNSNQNSFFEIYQKIFKSFCYFLIILILISLFISMYRKNFQSTSLLLLLFGGSGACVALGLSVFDMSMGWHLGGMYDLPVAICFILVSITAINYSLKISENFYFKPKC